MPTNTFNEFRAASVDFSVRVSVEEKAPVHLSDEYLEFMRRMIDAEKSQDFKLTPTSPSGW